MMNGHILEGTSICVDYWLFTPHKKYFHFLSHLHSDHTYKLSSTFRDTIYTSPFNSWLVKRWFNIAHDKVVSLSLGEPHIIFDGDTAFNVTLINANHCPGSVMFLFEGEFGNILYTGDFRYCPAILENPMLKSLIDHEMIHKLYLDNTFAAEHCQFPSRKEALKQVLDLVKSHPDHYIVIGVRKLGKEEVLRAIAKQLKEKVAVSPERMAILEMLRFEDVFTTSLAESRILARDMHLINGSYLFKLKEEKGPVLTILLSALDSVTSAMQSTSRVKEDKLLGIHRIPYSDHSCHSELVKFVSRIKPGKIYPIVSPSSNKRTTRRNSDDHLLANDICLIPESIIKLSKNNCATSNRFSTFESPGRSVSLTEDASTEDEEELNLTKRRKKINVSKEQNADCIPESSNCDVTLPRISTLEENLGEIDRELNSINELLLLSQSLLLKTKVESNLINNNSRENLTNDESSENQREQNKRKMLVNSRNDQSDVNDSQPAEEVLSEVQPTKDKNCVVAELPDSTNSLGTTSQFLTCPSNPGVIGSIEDLAVESQNDLPTEDEFFSLSPVEPLSPGCSENLEKADNDVCDLTKGNNNIPCQDSLSLKERKESNTRKRSKQSSKNQTSVTGLNEKQKRKLFNGSINMDALILSPNVSSNVGNELEQLTIEADEYIALSQLPLLSRLKEKDRDVNKADEEEKKLSKEVERKDEAVRSDDVQNKEECALKKIDEDEFNEDTILDLPVSRSKVRKLLCDLPPGKEKLKNSIISNLLRKINGPLPAETIMSTNKSSKISREPQLSKNVNVQNGGVTSEEELKITSQPFAVTKKPKVQSGKDQRQLNNHANEVVKPYSETPYPFHPHIFVNSFQEALQHHKREQLQRKIAQSQSCNDVLEEKRNAVKRQDPTESVSSLEDLSSEPKAGTSRQAKIIDLDESEDSADRPKKRFCKARRSVRTLPEKFKSLEASQDISLTDSDSFRKAIECGGTKDQNKKTEILSPDSSTGSSTNLSVAEDREASDSDTSSVVEIARKVLYYKKKLEKRYGGLQMNDDSIVFIANGNR